MTRSREVLYSTFPNDGQALTDATKLAPNVSGVTAINEGGNCGEKIPQKFNKKFRVLMHGGHETVVINWRDALI